MIFLYQRGQWPQVSWADSLHLVWAGAESDQGAPWQNGRFLGPASDEGWWKNSGIGWCQCRCGMVYAWQWTMKKNRPARKKAGRSGISASLVRQYLQFFGPIYFVWSPHADDGSSLEQPSLLRSIPSETIYSVGSHWDLLAFRFMAIKRHKIPVRSSTIEQWRRLLSANMPFPRLQVANHSERLFPWLWAKYRKFRAKRLPICHLRLGHWLLWKSLNPLTLRGFPLW